jgi:predicted HicB family RNase H-like nuclease
MTAFVTTEKKKVSVYLEESLKIDAMKLADLEKRSLNNLVEVVLQAAVDKAKLEGRIK